jgi:hypothetical protein
LKINTLKQNCLFVVSKIGNENVNVLIKSPASLFSVEIFEMLGFDKSILQIENSLLNGTDGGEIEVYGKTKNKFDLNSTQLKHELVIDMQGILGMYFWEENDAHFGSASKLKIKQNSLLLLQNPTKVCAFVKIASCTVIPASFEILFDVYISGEITPAKQVIVGPKKTHRKSWFSCVLSPCRSK